MALVTINESTLTSIADAIREKGGFEAPMKPADMVVAIDNLPIMSEKALNLTGNCNYRFVYDAWNWFIDEYGYQITTEDIIDIGRMFYNSKALQAIPFDINMKAITTSYHDIDYAFSGCYALLELPKINNARPDGTKELFNSCYRIREIPSSFYETWDWSYLDGLTSGYAGDRGNTFSSCRSLRKVPIDFLKHANPKSNYSYSIYSNGFNGCYALDEIVNLPIPYTAAWTSNAFSYFANDCRRLKNLTFALQEDGTPYVVQWKSQTIDLTKNVGHHLYSASGSSETWDASTVESATSSAEITKYNSGITIDKAIYNAATYAALKDDPDAYCLNSNNDGPRYSRYNHDSAVATINSLPDTSAYGTNTIKFTGAAGSATDGGAINTLTEEEIAVAAAKGWTVTLV